MKATLRKGNLDAFPLVPKSFFGKGLVMMLMFSIVGNFKRLFLLQNPMLMQ
jgi:hypothetical protein